jgi:hypothetical protein
MRISDPAKIRMCENRVLERIFGPKREVEK